MKIKLLALLMLCFTFNFQSFSQTFALDSLFGENGNSVLVGSTNDTYTTKKIIKNNQNEVFVAGTFGATWPGFYMDFVFKTNSCGIVDSSFGIEGMASANLFNCEDIAIQNDNKIIVSGNSQGTEIYSYPCLKRLNEDGSLDETFNSTSLDVFGFSEFYFDKGSFKKIEIQQDEKLLCTGYYQKYENSVINVYTMLMRFLPNGTPDSTFGNNGLSISYLGTNYGNVNFSEILCTSNDTKIVLGEVSNNLKAIAFSSEGVVETSYGVNGIFSDSIANGYSLKAINIDDTFFYAYQINEDSIVFKKLLPNGFLDSNFGLDGSLLLNFNNQDFAFLKSIIALPDNCVGVVVVSSEFIKISCFSSNGILINTITIDSEIQYLSNSYIALQEDDKYIIADFFYPNNLAIKRFTNQSLVPHITYLNDSLYANVESPVLAYQWYLNDVIINDATNASYQPSTEGTYSVTVTDTVECGYFTATFQLETVSIPAIEDQTLLMYPNPTKDFIKVKCFNGCKSYEILDARGCTMLRGDFNAESSIIDVSNLSNGIYMIRTDEDEVKRISVNK